MSMFEKLSESLKAMKTGLIVLTVFYIFWQISLSGAILTASDLETSQFLSNLARWTVGFGGFLFTFKVTWTKVFTRKGRHGFWAIPLILGLLAGGFFVWAEDAIVNHYAGKTDAQARMDARTIQLFNSAVLQGKVNLPDLPSSIVNDPVMSKAFLKVLGFAIWNNPELVKRINAERLSVVRAVQAGDFYKKIDVGYLEYRKKYDELQEIRQNLNSIPYGQWTPMLNRILGNYASCKNDSCRQELIGAVSGYFGKYAKSKGMKIDFDIDLEAFCSVRNEKKFFMARETGGTKVKVCSASEKELREYVEQMVSKRVASAADANLPQEIRSRLAGPFIPIDEWRAIFKNRIDREIEKQADKEFANSERFGENGANPREGRDFAVSVFLPPVALGFSILVCFMHLANILSMVFGHAKIWVIAVIPVCLAPLAFAPAVPLSGMTSFYARWLMEWEKLLYPFGIFRGLLL